MGSEMCIRDSACALFTLRLNKRCRVEQLIPKMNATEGVVSVEEL